MIKTIFTIFFIFFQSLTIFERIDIFEKISNKTWFEETGFAGETVVFVKTEKGVIKAFRQINGSGVPVIATKVYDMEIRQDTIYLLSSHNEQTNGDSTNIFYTYNNQKGLLRNGKPLRMIFDEPIIYVQTGKRKIIHKQINASKLTKISFEKNKVYIKDEVFKLNIED